MQSRNVLKNVDDNTTYLKTNLRCFFLIEELQNRKLGSFNETGNSTHIRIEKYRQCSL